ncbi:MAG: 2-dehydropantoate 2-reductase N-terminal domain-containing protein [Alphaproteobacteria bacterium]
MSESSHEETSSMQQTVCVLGLGYIGLPTASFLATKGCKVIGVDVSAKVVETINRAEVHIREPEAQAVVRSAVHSGNLKAQTEPSPADVFFITVPTPVQDDRSRTSLCQRQQGVRALVRPAICVS